MTGRWVLLLLLLMGPLFGAPSRESAAVQEMRLLLQQFDRQIHSYKVELDLMHERLQSLERERQKTPQVATTRPLETRLVALEESQEALASDLKTLKKSLNKTSTTLTTCQTKLSKIDKQLTTDIQSLKASLQSMLALLGQEVGKSYTVKVGDSLGQIALDHKTDVKTLKTLNGLNTDIIHPGQKLKMP